MFYFNQDDFCSLLSLESSGDLHGNLGLQRLHKRLVDLHNELYPCIKKHDLKLHPNPELPGGVSQKSASIPTPANSMTLIYTRAQAEAKIVEAIMGRDALSAVESVEAHRHPVIELRITPDHLAIEFVVSPDAWYDQQNFIGKLSVSQNRHRLYQILSRMDGNYLLGFWCGIHLDDTCLSTEQLPPAPILYEYLDTFADRRDWFRIGRWYTFDSPALHADNIVQEVFERVRDLYQIYAFVAWSNTNNFHSLYRKLLKRSKR